MFGPRARPSHMDRTSALRRRREGPSRRQRAFVARARALRWECTNDAPRVRWESTTRGQEESPWRGPVTPSARRAASAARRAASPEAAAPASPFAKSRASGKRRPARTRDEQQRGRVNPGRVPAGAGGCARAASDAEEDAGAQDPPSARRNRAAREGAGSQATSMGCRRPKEGLDKLAEEDDANCTAIARRLVGLLSGGSADGPGARPRDVLGKIAYDNAANRAVIAEAGAIPPLMALVSRRGRRPGARGRVRVALALKTRPTRPRSVGPAASRRSWRS